MEQKITFFSYSRTDSAFVLKLAKDLRNAGEALWLDQLDIVAGSHWDSSIEAALNAASRLIIILSPSAVNSANVMDEVSFALENGKAIIPILVSECKIPFRLRRLQWVDFTGDYSRGLNQLFEVLGNSNLVDDKKKANPFSKHKKHILISGVMVLVIFAIWGMKKYNSTGKREELVTVADSLLRTLPSPADTTVELQATNTIVKLKNIITTTIIPLPEKERVYFDTSKWYRLTTSWQECAGKSMEVTNPNNYYTPVELGTTGDFSRQAWKIRILDNGYIQFFNKEFGTRMSMGLIDVGDHFATQLDTSGYFKEQLWKITTTNMNGYYKLTTWWKGDTMALDVRNDGQNNALQLNPLKDTVLNGARTSIPYAGQYWLIKPF